MRELRSRVSEEKKDVDRFSEQVVSTDRRRGIKWKICRSTCSF